MNRFLFINFGLLILLVAACGTAEPDPTSTIEVGSTVSAENTLPPTDTPPTATQDAGSFLEVTPLPTAIPTDTPTPVPTDTPIPTPSPSPTVPTEVVNEIPSVELPEGFSLIKFADFDRPTSLTFDPNGILYATSLAGTIHAIVDDDDDGRADRDVQLSFGFDTPLGIAVHPDNGDIYVSQMGKITILRDLDGDLVADEVERFVADLPFGRHQNNNLKFGADGWLYVGVGSTCDVCYEEDERSATIMRFDPATGQGEVVATGLRNAFDIAFHPVDGSLFATENGRDDLGSENPAEELNHIVMGGDYGFPDCWGALEGTNCDGTTQAVAFFEPRSSTNSIDFYAGDRFPARYQNALFAAIWGSYEAQVARGIRYVTLTPDGDTYTSQVAWFARFPENRWLLGLIVGPDGALYFGDYMDGGIYRISYGLP